MKSLSRSMEKTVDLFTLDVYISVGLDQVQLITLMRTQQFQSASV